MAGDINDAFIIQYESEFSHALQQTESMLRSTVWQNSGVVGSQVRFPVLATVSSTKNRARHNILAGDGDAHTNATATLSNYEAYRFIDSLDEFKTNISLRQGYTESIVAELNRNMDNEIITAMNTTYTSEGSAAAMSKARMAGLREIAGEQNWSSTQGWHLAVTPAIFSEVLQLTEVSSGDYSEKGNFDGLTRSVNVYGIHVMEVPELDNFNASASNHYGFFYAEKSVGLGIGRDITPKINYSPAHNADIVLGEMSTGAVTIQQSGVYRVSVNGL
ncbi:phage capsid protein [Rhodospirillales bacterium]|jgi:hypothetical protein|nr:phage capsid protein [Rhodospirillales bacterium]